MADDDRPDPTTGPFTETGTDVDATDKMPENVPSTGDEAEQIGRREGMFGVTGTGDTSGYGGLTRPVEMPGASQPPYGGWMDEVATTLAEATRSAGLEAAVEKVARSSLRLRSPFQNAIHAPRARRQCFALSRRRQCFAP